MNQTFMDVWLTWFRTLNLLTCANSISDTNENGWKQVKTSDNSKNQVKTYKKWVKTGEKRVKTEENGWNGRKCVKTDENVGKQVKMGEVGCKCEKNGEYGLTNGENG